MGSLDLVLYLTLAEIRKIKLISISIGFVCSKNEIIEYIPYFHLVSLNNKSIRELTLSRFVALWAE